MAKHLTEQDRQQIVGILDGWPADSKLTWDRLLDRIGHRLGINPTRQTLSRDPRIKLAFQNRKEGKPHPVRQSATEKSLRQKVERLKAENARLEKEKALFLEMFTRWQYNAHKHGLTEERLGQPLPRIDRGRSD